MVSDLSTFDYLFLKFRSLHVKLEDVVKEYYPHLCKERMLERVRQNRFPFSCFRMDDSQKGTLFVDIRELAEVIDDIYRKQHTIFQNRTQKAIQSLN
ncbi:pyocin activator PrtN family protein [Acinetobacter seifertii]|uniref:pyocin activator PrtN family protein n=1 Tax=Acinetobacter TaxID=469 RepID=UPI0018FF34F6|nr:pyocin activator PrtN family protein [Acinetobacter seifertii]MBJ8504368.1 pyocin activator PrtN family protein [Acinetobacter seifertii]